MVDHGQWVVPATTRSRLMLEVASELVGGKKWVQRQATISLRPQGRGSWPLTKPPPSQSSQADHCLLHAANCFPDQREF